MVEGVSAVSAVIAGRFSHFVSSVLLGQHLRLHETMLTLEYSNQGAKRGLVSLATFFHLEDLKMLECMQDCIRCTTF